MEMVHLFIVLLFLTFLTFYFRFAERRKRK